MPTAESTFSEGLVAEALSSPAARGSVWRRWAPTVVMMWLAFWLRVHHLDYRALWWDEGLSLFFAQLDFRENAAMAVRLADTNPPAYRMSLGGWTSAAGSSAFAARMFSALPGAVVVAGTFAIGRRWFGRGAGRTAALLAAASPMLVYYSQEAKAYSLVAAMGMLSILFWERWLQAAGEDTPWRRATPIWIGYTLSVAVAVTSHYIAAFLLAVHGLWALLATPPHLRRGTRQRRALRTWPALGGAWLIAALLLSPFVLLTFGQTSAAIRGETGEFEGLGGPVRFFGQHALEFAVGPGPASAVGWTVAAILTALAVFGGATQVKVSSDDHSRRAGGATEVATTSRVGSDDFSRRAGGATEVATTSRVGSDDFSRRAGGATEVATTSQLRGHVCLWSWLLLPLLGGFALNSYHQFFFPRFLLYTVPAFLLLAARGLTRLPLRPWAAALTTLGLLGLWTMPLAAHYADGGDPAEDWRPLAQSIRPYLRAGDGAIYGWGWMPGYLHAYLPPAPEPAYYLGFYSPETLDSQLTAVAAAHARIWLLGYHIDALDRYNAAGRWLAERGALIYSEWFGNAQAVLFAMPALSARPVGPEREVTFDEGISLRYRPVAAQAAPGEALVVALEWRAASAPERPYKVFLQVVAADGRLVAGRDTEPANGLRPTDGWAPGESVPELRGLLLPPDLPVGEYSVRVGLYDPESGGRLNSSEGDAVGVGQVTVLR